MIVTLDSSAWIEYFSGSELGEIARSYIDSEDDIVTSAISLMEIKAKYQREKKPWKDRIRFVIERSNIVDVDSTVALAAAEIRTDSGLHSSDAMIYATATLTKSKLLTKDGHFKELSNVVMLE
jgi:predicted nucleic acid-binding protein